VTFVGGAAFITPVYLNVPGNDCKPTFVPTGKLGDTRRTMVPVQLPTELPGWMQRIEPLTNVYGEPPLGGAGPGDGVGAGDGDGAGEGEGAPAVSVPVT
jgi:hypothetical protein